MADELTFVAGIKKLHAICSSAFWILDNSLAVLQGSHVQEVRFGSARVGRGSREWLQLRAAVVSFEALLANADLLGIIQTTSYANILTVLQHGH